MQLRQMCEVIKGVRYDASKATLVAEDWPDWCSNGSSGRSRHLFKGRKGRFFLVCMTLWENERNQIIPLSREEALEYWDLLPEKHISYEEAFGIVPEEA